MKQTIVTGKRVDDSYVHLSHPSGLQIYVYPKPQSNTTYAVFGTKYGSIDNCFQRSDEPRAETVPEGIAHYLEHKLFESEDGDAFARFAKTGASANAFTSFESTCYLFSCTDHFDEAFDILLDFVQTPYFTKETVEKEQGIIAQEIKMYDDDPQWQLMFNLLRALYHHHPIKEDIAGTVESISKITPELLYRCYHTFYNLHNMALCVVGNVTVEQVLAHCDRLLKPSEPVSVQRVFTPEPKEIVTPYVEQKLSVASPLFQLGYKEAVAKEDRTEAEVAAMEVLLEVLASDASPLFRRLLDAELVNEASFSCEYFEGASYAAVLFTGESKDPERVAAEIQSEIARLQQEGLDPDAFLRAKKSIYGELIGLLNSAAGISNTILALSFKKRELFRLIDAVAEVTMEQSEALLRTVFLKSQSALSMIKPREGSV